MNKILRFTASWCQPCKALANNLESANLSIPIEVIDIDVYPELVADFGIRGVPTLVYIKDGVEFSRIVGVKSAHELQDWVEAK